MKVRQGTYIKPTERRVPGWIPPTSTPASREPRGKWAGFGVPAGNSRRGGSPASVHATNGPLAAPLQQDAPTGSQLAAAEARRGRNDNLIGMLSLAAGALALAVYLTERFDGIWHYGIPAGLVIILGTWLVWLNIGRKKINWSLAALGATYVTAGILGIFAPWDSFRQLAQILLSVLLILIALVLLALPLWATIRAQLAHAESEEIKERERADLAAHLHDSVLQTLALIQAHPEDPQRVAALARREERQLRTWLYGNPTKGASLSVQQLVEEQAAEVEDRFNLKVEVVVTGDRPAGQQGENISALLREALTNAAKHGEPPISVYVECGREFEAFIKDHGPGFELADLEQVPGDRHGVRDSLVKRAKRAGGEVRIRKLASGTEVSIRLPWAVEKAEGKN
ncbi:sensor histidine kinase [Boudabousia liubingyangii]|uniref:sensor histidine kinase n=1 Tax=Boudabousia liubingyangii TaxID=1921764 RepID=UPI00093EAD50|nr:ATP-binding protein [Boudabousia liubingyangii]